MSVVAARLHRQLLADNGGATPHEVVAHLGAVQAQDYLGALWAVGARMKTAVESDVERALAERSIVRCWPMRGTLHFVAAEDVRWMLELLAPGVLTRHRPRLEREFGLDARTLRRSRPLVERALRGGIAMTRSEIYALIENGGIATGGSRGLHILFALAHERVICFGARRGKQPTLVLLDEWVPPAKSKTREEALAEIARRYFIGHGPATVADLMWWSGLTMKETKEAIALAGVDVESEANARVTRPSVQLLPPFDEYAVGYKDRTSILDPAVDKAIVVIDGLAAGQWKRTLRGESVDITISPFRALTAHESRALERAANRYAAFLGRTR